MGVARHDENLDGNGRIILWITFGLMAGSAVGFAVLGARKPMEHRSHAFISTAIVSIAAAAYYSLATDSGYSFFKTFDNSPYPRAIFWCRYIDWFFTTPLLLLDVLLISGLSWGGTLIILGCDISMIVLGLFGAVTVGKYKWGWYGAACGFQFLIIYGLLVPGLQSARRRNPSLVKYYLGFAGYLSILWFGYPIVWGLAEGSNTITSDAEGASYAGLDIAAKVIFGWALMLSSGIIHKVQAEEAKRGTEVDPLQTPINNLWGQRAVSTSVSTTTVHQRPTAGAHAVPNVPVDVV